MLLRGQVISVTRIMEYTKRLVVRQAYTHVPAAFIENKCKKLTSLKLIVRTMR